MLGAPWLNEVLVMAVTLIPPLPPSILLPPGHPPCHCHADTSLWRLALISGSLTFLGLKISCCNFYCFNFGIVRHIWCLFSFLQFKVFKCLLIVHRIRKKYHDTFVRIPWINQFLLTRDRVRQFISESHWIKPVGCTLEAACWCPAALGRPPKLNSFS